MSGLLGCRRRTRRLFLSVAEYAALTGAKPATVRKRLERGTLRGKQLRPGGRWRVYTSELRERSTQ